MDTIERDRQIASSTDDLEATSAEWADAIADRDNARANRALDDLEAIVKKLREVW